MNAVLRPGHVQLRVLDLEESVHFYREVLGLVESGRDAQGRVYMKTWAERDHSSVIMREAPTPGLDALAFKVRSPAALAQLEASLQAAGVSCTRIAAGDLLATGERVQFRLPSGHVIELYAHKDAASTGAALIDPPLWDADSEQGIAVQRLDHCVLYGPALDEVRDLFTGTLGFFLTERALAQDGVADFGVWLSTSSRPCDIVLVRHVDAGKLHHVSFRVGSTEQVLKAADCFSMARMQIDAGPFRDPATGRFSVQAFDPSGIRIEVFFSSHDAYPDQAPITWRWKKGGAAMTLRDQRTRDRLFPDLT
ncbi:MAG: VOC family protein [Desulfobacterales bacterium]|nr:VOC family protein [Desulfobacterales bacterium]